MVPYVLFLLEYFRASMDVQMFDEEAVALYLLKYMDAIFLNLFVRRNMLYIGANSIGGFLWP